jgi:hypothetical protein
MEGKICGFIYFFKFMYVQMILIADQDLYK